MELLPISFIAGILTILAPCVLPLLPVIIGGGVAGTSIKKPIIITLSLAFSITLFTLLLKFSTIFITIPDFFWKYFSAIIIFIFAISLLFPRIWVKLVSKFSSGKLKNKFEKIAFKFSQKDNTFSAIILGMALGPVFAACSPTYFVILGTVLPASFSIGLLNLIAYSLGLGLIMFFVAFTGQKMMNKLNIVANPDGWFKKILGILFLIVSLSIITGYDKKFENLLLNIDFFSFSTNLEQNILKDYEKQK